MKRAVCLAIVAFAVTLPSTVVRAQILSYEQISPVTVVPGQPIDLWFPNVFDLDHQKLLYFEGSAISLATSGPPTAPLMIGFDWLDVAGGTQTTPLTPFQPGGIYLEDVLDFCPAQVSIHFSTEDRTGYIVEGVFVHECLVPEPHEYALMAGLGLIGFATWRRRRA